MILINWLKQIDVTKAVVLAIISIIGSWYDVRGQVALLKQEANIRWEKQDKKDQEQDQTTRDMREEVREGLRDIKQTIIQQGHNAKR